MVLGVMAEAGKDAFYARAANDLRRRLCIEDETMPQQAKVSISFTMLLL
jgi:hypothetical protein